MKKAIISGGGTGGHIFPAIAIANALKELDGSIEILFVGAEGKMEMDKVPDAGYEIIGLPVRGFQRKLTLQNFVVLWNLFKSLRKAKKIVKDFKPDVVVGVGGYASGPLGRVASKHGVPLVLQEQNSYPGVTNKILAKKAAKICVAYEGMERFFAADKIILTGNPVRKDLLDSANKRDEGLEFYGLDRNRKTVLVTGGSLGAGSINNAVEQHIDLWRNMEDVQILWQCGGYYCDDLEKRLKNILPSNVKLTAFLKRMDLAYACADAVVARAGATTISELCLLGKPAILIPSPNVTEDHQTKNAMALVNKDAAMMIKNSEVEDKLGKTLQSLLNDDDKRKSLSTNILKLAKKDSDIRIAQEVINIMNNKK